MNVVSKYIEKSKINLFNIVKNLDDNIEFLNNNLWASKEEFDTLINNVINIYYDNYYLYNKKDYKKLDMYISYNKKMNSKLKNILMSIIEYYESIDSIDIIRKKDSSILYLDILIYMGLKLYNEDFYNIGEPKKIEKVINSVIDNFAKIRFKKEKDLILLINNIKESVIYNNGFNEYLNKFNSNNSYNLFVKVNKDINIYKVLYEYKIHELSRYDSKDINIVINKLNINKEFSKISFDLCYYTMFKLLRNGIDKQMLFPISKSNFESIYKYFVDNRNKSILDNIKFVIDYQELANDYNFINMIVDNDIDLYVEVSDSFVTNNYNMFMNMKNIIVVEQFLSINEKYLEIWKDMNINFIIKDFGSKINEELLLK